MKTRILNFILILFALPALSQGLVVQAEQIDVQIVNQDGLMLISSLGEAMNSLDLSGDLTVVGGYYPSALFDTTAPSGTRDYPPIEGLQAWPNPTSDAVILETTDKQHSAYRITLYNDAGQGVDTRTWSTGSFTIEIPLGIVVPGTYFIEVFDHVLVKRSVLTVLKQ